MMNIELWFAECPAFVTRTDGEKLLTGYNKLNNTTEWEPALSRREGAQQTIK